MTRSFAGAAFIDNKEKKRVIYDSDIIDMAFIQGMDLMHKPNGEPAE